MVNILKPNSVVTNPQSAVVPAKVLTPRQLEVLALLCEGLPNKLISRRLGIASGTVKVHVVQVLRALDVGSRLQAVVAARNLGLVDAAYNLLPLQATASALGQASALRPPGSSNADLPWREAVTGGSLVTA